MQHRGWQIGWFGQALAPAVLLLLVTAPASTSDILDGLWLAVAFATLAHWSFRRDAGHRAIPELLSLAVILVLLFPIVSADDDLLLFSPPDDALTAVSSGEKHKHVGLIAKFSPAATAPPSWLPAEPTGVVITAESPVQYLSAPDGHATGNHSPPVS